MPSPFPGMNPYLEREGFWTDFHDRYVPAAAEAMLSQLVPKYIVQVTAHAYIHELPASDRRLLIGRPDNMVIAGPALDSGAIHRESALIEAPARVRLPLAVDIERRPYLEIRDRDSQQVITVVELLSPSNKYRGADREQYVAKRDAVLHSSAHLVEIDLLRGGPRLPMDGLPDTDYCVLVSRAGDRPNAGVWAVSLRDRLPVIPIPLAPPDGDVRLDLLLETAGLYRNVIGARRDSRKTEKPGII